MSPKYGSTIVWNVTYIEIEILFLSRASKNNGKYSLSKDSTSSESL